VLFVIYALLAVPFRSYLQPLIVMSVIPFGAAGAMLGHMIMGMTLTIMSLMGRRSAAVGGDARSTAPGRIDA
ncbi:MAG: efflux RND transporter permease subunit, partial [Trueperaceae bacterium]